MSSLKKKISVVGAVGIPAAYGGFETFTEQLALRLSKHFRITVYCSSRSYPENLRMKTWKGINREFINLPANGVMSVLYDFRSLRMAATNSDYILLLGCGAGIMLWFLRRSIRDKIWLHIDGIEWNRKKWNPLIRLLLRISFYFGIKAAKRVIVDNEAMLPRISQSARSKKLLLGYGADHLPNTPLPAPLPDPYLLVISRSVPENNLSMIIEGFLHSEFPTLVIISNWKDSRYGRNLRKEYQREPRLRMLDAIYTPDTLQAYRKYALAYIHGHSAGGTNPSLIEAMGTPLPILAFDNEFNRNVTLGNSLYFATAAELTHQIDHLNPSELKQQAGIMSEAATKLYRWDNVVMRLKNDLDSHSFRHNYY